MDNQKVEEILDLYRNDERLLRFTKKLEEEVKNNISSEKNLEELYCEHSMEAYWEDIGGEGA